jgi:hypothetical protein
MTIQITRDLRSREWRAVIPVEYWDSFLEYSREIRLSMRVRKTAVCGVFIAIPAGFTRSEVEGTVGYFFDGVLDVEVRE